MHTYYQKHRQIQATQFDGRLTTLAHNLPTSIFNELLQKINQDDNFAPYQLILDTKTNLIQHLVINNEYLNWNKSHRKHRYRTQKYMSAIYDRKHNNWTSTDHFRYLLTPRNLNYGDYFVIKSVMNQYHRDQWQKPNGWLLFSETYVVVIPKRQFEAQWSQTPIKKHSFKI